MIGLSRRLVEQLRKLFISVRADGDGVPIIGVKVVCIAFRNDRIRIINGIDVRHLGRQLHRSERQENNQK